MADAAGKGPWSAGGGEGHPCAGKRDLEQLRYFISQRQPEGSLFRASRKSVGAGSSVALFTAQRGANLRQGVKGGNFAGGHHVGRFGEIVPDKLLYIRLDDDVRLRAPGKVGMALHDVERAAKDVSKCARLL